MAKKTDLIIVESPTKAKTISGMLHGEFQIESSFGHVRDLPKSKLGIDTENNFTPQYLVPKKSKETVSKLKKLAENSEKIILATDEDREGEAIAWHLAEILKSDRPKKTERITFHEITEKALHEALKHPREIDINLVNAQQARRVLDRLVGYKLSPFLWKKMMSRLSAGRVQSVALRLIVDREREIQSFKPIKYFTIEAELKNKNGQKFISYLYAINKKTIQKPGILDKNETLKILTELKKTKNWKIVKIEKKEKIKHPYPPFTTSTLQQAAWNFYKFSAKKTMVVAQQLYEGVKIKDGGHTGLITYMRTDSLNLSEEAVSFAAGYIENNIGKEYALPNGRRFKTKSKSAQEAHEAIRPTDINLEPDKIKNDLSNEQYKLYKLIWQRFTATQMANAVFHETNIDILAENIYSFESKGLILKFDGFIKIYPVKTEENILPNLSENDKIEADKIEMKEHETKPPPRFNEASLIKTLEKFGIGRPSTYAPTISTIQERGYAVKNSNKSLEPTEIGIKVVDLLKEHFADIVDINFTAKMEENLDKIADGKIKWQPVIKEFYDPFNKNLETKYEEVKKQVITEETDEICEKCGKKMLIKFGRFGKFIACSGFPECKNTKPMPKKTLGIKCPKCADGEIVEKKTIKRKRIFYGCSKYPECDFSTWDLKKIS